MTPQYLCQSYYDDDGTIHDCTCGKCSLMNPTAYKEIVTEAQDV
jgi:hypothetical protein